MRRLRKDTRGSITVLVTLILIPTIFFNGVLVDLSRIKLCGNQAVMAADNYGEAVLKEYDALLKEMYGLFAVTQDTDALKALDTIKDYTKTSFNPADKSISFGYYADLQKALGVTAKAEGFMPYKDAAVNLSYEPVAAANLKNTAIFGTQTAEFMKFRIVQQLYNFAVQNKESNGGVMPSLDTMVNQLVDTVDQTSKTKEMSEVLEIKAEYDELAGEVLKKTEKYYNCLDVLKKYPDYIKLLNAKYQVAKDNYKEIVESEDYKSYKKKKDSEGQNNTPGENTESVETEDGETDNGEAGATYDALKKRFDDEIKELEKQRYTITVEYNIQTDFDNYTYNAQQFSNAAQELQKKLDELKIKKAELDSALAKISDSEAKTKIQEDIDAVGIDTVDMDRYWQLAERYVNFTGNQEYQIEFGKILKNLEQVRDDYLDGKEKEQITPFHEKLDEQKANKLLDQPFAQIYGKRIGDSSEKSKKYKDMQKNAKSVTDGKADALNAESEECDARDIPESLGIPGTASATIDFSGLLAECSGMLKTGSLSGAGNRALDKIYLTCYDFGMFSSRVTNLDEDAVSLTNVPMGKNVNYLYGAEMEYLLGGSLDSSNNLDLVRNRIVAFRFVVNLTATYTIKEINDPISAIRKAASAINPILGIAVSAALRTAVATVESYKDWEKLKNGESVVLIKTKAKQLNAWSDIKDLIGGEERADTGSSENAIALNYNQYLMVLILVMMDTDTLAERSANLVTLNVNTVRQKIGQEGNLSSLNWTLDKAVTAVEAKCSYHLDFVVMPDGFAKKTVSTDTYNEIQQFEGRTYQFSVTRGY